MSRFKAGAGCVDFRTDPWRRRGGIRIHAILILTLAIVMLSGCHAPGTSAGLEPQSEDYRAARGHFHTKLIRQGPAPQQWPPMHPPEGAVQIEYAAANGCRAWLTPPEAGNQSSAKRPSVLFLHGGFALGSEDWDMTQPYRDAGYVVMEPALRGENGQGGIYSMFYDEVDDVLSAADYLAGLPYVDSTHLYLAGHSVGGTLTMLAAMTTDRFRAAAAFSGSPDQIAWSRNQPQLVPFSPADPDEYRMRSPIAYATSFKCPVRIFHGSDEPFFAASSERTAEMAKSKGLDIEAVTVPGGHMSAVPEEIRRSIEFFKGKQ